MQKTNFSTTINLSDHFLDHNLSDLLKVFPELKEKISKGNGSLPNFAQKPFTVDKFIFYQSILEKMKNYFELNEKFLISESLSIMLKDIKELSKKVNNKDLKKDNFKKKEELPCINTLNTPSLKKYLTDDGNKNNFIRKAKRSYSTKSNGNEKINGPKKSNFKNKHLFDEVNDADINYVYINFKGNKNQKLKVVHFAENETINVKKGNNIMNKSFTRKSNLKKGNIKKEFNLTMTQNQKSLLGNRNKNGKIKYFLKTKTEYPIRNKSNGKLLKEKKQLIETKESEKIKEISSSHNTTVILNEIDLDRFNIDDKDFDIFEFDKKVGKENTLSLIGKYIFKNLDFGEILNQTKYENWCQKISEGYNRNNFYHTDLHAADITHTSYIYFKEGLINEIIKLDKSSICALFLSCICHDYKHPGLNNNYLMETNNSIAIRYNDISILENMHISETFKLIHSDKNCNIFENFERQNYKKMRKQMILCVLGTDMSNHKHSLDFMNKCLNENNQITEKDNQDYMNLIVHSADISNPTKKFEIYYKWAELVVEEFYQQGDKEKELGLNCSCDRNKVSLYKSQLGFIDFVEKPFYGLFTKLFPKLNFLDENLNKNREKIKMLENENNKNKDEKTE